MKRWWAVVGLLAVLGCESGQTGSASCAPACQCQFLTGAHVAKGTVIAIDGSLVTLQVDQILDDDPNSLAYNGSAIVGSTYSLNCGHEAIVLPNVGDEVFATFYDSYEDDAGTERLLRTEPWSDQIRLSEGTVVPLADAIELAEPGKCEQRYPVPCNDTGSNDDGSIICSTAHVGGASSQAPVALLVGASLLGLGVLRRHKRR